MRLPAAPAEFSAQRRGDDIELQFTVPTANTDNSRPANIQRVDVYGFTGPANVTDVQLFKYGTRVGSVDVKAPRDPDAAADADESESDVEPPTGKGLDQGARAHVDEQMSSDLLNPVPLASGRRTAEDESGAAPLLGVAIGPPSRTYVSVGISTRGRRGAVSKRITVPLLPPPPAPAAPTVTYTESAITVSWTVPGATQPSGLLPSHALGAAEPTVGFNVYEVKGPGASPGGAETSRTPAPAATADATPAAPREGTVETRLTSTPVASTEYSDARVTWGTERCYSVRTVETISGATIESDPGPERCVKLVDTFPPAAPKQLTAVASEGAISLIWEPNTEADLAGYLVLRGISADTLQPITPAPVVETTFKDTVQPGTRYVYAVQAVDKAGNASKPSDSVEEMAR